MVLRNDGCSFIERDKPVLNLKFHIMKQNKAKYAGSAAVLYLIVKVVCDLAVKQLKDFSKLKKKYTQAFFDDILKSLSAAEAMPNNSARKGVQSDKRTGLEELNVIICALFQTFLLYIEEGFDESRWEDMKQVAGGDYYEAAAKETWKASKTMQEMAIAFMTKYAVELALGEMPSDFATNFTTQNKAFLDALLLFSTGKSTTGEETADKLTANNDLYKRIAGVMRDGKRIFANDAALYKQFSYAAQKKLLGGQGKTGFRFSLKVADTLVPVTAASVEFLPSGDVFTEVNEEGVLLVYLPELKKDDVYKYLLTSPGMEELAGELVAETGVMHRVDLILKPEVMVVTSSEGTEKVS